MLENSTNQKKINTLRDKLKSLLTRYIPNKELVDIELNIFDKTISRRDFLTGAGKISSVAALIGGGIVPSSWALSRPDIGLPKSEMPFISDALKAGAKAVSIGVSCDVADGTILHESIEHVDAKNLETVIEGLNVHLKAQETPVENTNAILSSKLNNGFTKTYGHPEIIRIIDKPDGKSSDNYKAKQLIIHEWSSQNNYGGLHKSVIDLPFTDKDPLGQEPFDRYAKFYDYNHVVAVNGHRHNMVDNGKVLNQKMIAVIRNASDYEWSGYNGMCDWFSQTYQPQADDYRDYLNQFALYYQSSSHQCHTPDDNNMSSATEEEWKVIYPLDVLIKEFVESGCYIGDRQTVMKDDNGYIKGGQTAIEDINTFTALDGKQYIYGTIKIGYYRVYGFLIRLEGDEPVIQWFESANNTTLYFMEHFCNAAEDSGPMDKFEKFRQGYDPDDADMPKFDDFSGIFMGLLNSNLCHRFYKSIAINNANAIFSFNLIKGDDLNSFTDIETDQIMIKFSLDKNFINFHDSPSDHLIEFHNESTFLFSYHYYYGKSCNDFAIKKINGVLAENYPNTAPIASPHYNVLNYEDNSDDSAELIVIYANTIENNTGSVVHIHQVKASLEFQEYGFVSNHSNDEYIELAQPNTNIKKASLLLTKNHQDLFRLFVHGDSESDNEKGLLQIIRQSADKDYANEYLTPALSDDGNILFDDAVDINTNILRVLTWQRYYQNTEIVYVGLEQNSSIDKLQSTKQNLRDGQAQNSYHYSTQEALGLTWHTHKIKGKVAKNEDNIIKWMEKAHIMHASVQPLDIYGKRSALSEGDYIEVRTNQPCYIVNITDPESPVCIHSNRLNSYFVKPGMMGSVILEIQPAISDLYSGVELQTRIVTQSQFEKPSFSPKLKLNMQSNNDIHDWSPCINLAYRLHQRFDKQSDAYQSNANGIDATNNVHCAIDANLNSDYQDYKSDIHSSISSAMKKVSANSTPAKQNNINFVSLSSNQNELANPMLTGVGNKEIKGTSRSQMLLIFNQENNLGIKWPWEYVMDAVEAALKAIKKAVKWFKDKLENFKSFLDDLGIGCLVDGILGVLISACDRIIVIIDLAIMFIEILKLIMNFKLAQENGYALIQLGENHLPIVSDLLSGSKGTKPDVSKGLSDDINQKENKFQDSHEDDMHKGYAQNQLNKHIGISPGDSLQHMSSLGNKNNLTENSESIESLIIEFTKINLSVLELPMKEVQTALNSISDMLTNNNFNFSDLLNNLIKPLEEVESEIKDFISNTWDLLTDISIKDMLFGFMEDKIPLPSFIIDIIEFIFNIKFEKLKDITALIAGFPFMISYAVIKDIANNFKAGLPEDCIGLIKSHSLYDSKNKTNTSLRSSALTDPDTMAANIIGLCSMFGNLMKCVGRTFYDAKYGGGDASKRPQWLILAVKILNTAGDTCSLSTIFMAGQPQKYSETGWHNIEISAALLLDIFDDWGWWIAESSFGKEGTAASDTKSNFTMCVMIGFAINSLWGLIDNFINNPISGSMSKQEAAILQCQRYTSLFSIIRYILGAIKTRLNNKNDPEFEGRLGLSFIYSGCRVIQYSYNIESILLNK